MISAKLIQLIEEHSEAITDRVLRDFRHDLRLPHLSRLPESDLRDRCQEILHRLGHWLAESDQTEIRGHFETIGRMRAKEKIPLEEVVAGFQVLKARMLDNIRDQGLALTSVEVYAEEELEHQIGAFFDSVVYHTVKGYQAASELAHAMAH
jgi:hypothetical protein